MKIILNNKIYDITTFVNEHPGGAEIFTHMFDHTKQFNDIGHSSHALSLLSNFQYEEIEQSNINYNHNSTLTCNQKKISKLFTHEDKFNFHKICGTIVLLNYIVILIDLCLGGCKGKPLYIKPNIYTIILSWIHGLLSLSSFQFFVPKSRTGILPMIWQEFRGHSVSFALRSLIIINIIYFFGINDITNICRLLVVFVTMYSADMFTKYLRENTNESTTATMPYWSNINPIFQKYIKIFYTHAQLEATLVCLFSKNEITITYLILPIQLAAFLMTLVRKNIISSKTYHIIYGLSLLSGYIINIFNYGFYLCSILSIIAFYLRVNKNMNKYYIWFLIFSINNIKNNPLYLFTSICIFIFFRNKIFDKKQYVESNNRIVSNKEIFKDHHLITIKIINVIDFKPGQYINLFYDTIKRPYTPIFINQYTNEIEFLIKSYENGEVSNKITKNYINNAIIYYKGPFGTNYYLPKEDLFYSKNKTIDDKKINILMFSCGTGITPFYSMITNLKNNTRYNIYLYSSFKDMSQIYLYDKLKHEKLEKKIFLTENKLTNNKVKSILDQFNNSLTFIYICGTENYNSMISDIAKKNDFDYVYH